MNRPRPSTVGGLPDTMFVVPVQFDFSVGSAMSHKDPKPLLEDRLLEQSGIVANCRMNRERCLTGSNGYSRELGFHPLDLLREKAAAGGACWLDLCCGSGRALVEAARILDEEGTNATVEIVGVDLVGMFVARDPDSSRLRLVEASLSSWVPERAFDLITCVHGLHYIGDKLGLVTRAASWLKPDGLFAANIDLNNLRLREDRSDNRKFLAALRRRGLEYNLRRKLVICRGRKPVKLPYRYLGADDHAGPNYTGQPAVNSFYEVE